MNTKLGDLPWELGVISDPMHALVDDVARIRDCGLLPDRVQLSGWLYDVWTGRLNRIVESVYTPDRDVGPSIGHGGV